MNHHNLKYKTINVSNGEHVTDGIYHVQKVNNISRDFRGWVRNSFINVSTKYLQKYLNWYQMLKIMKSNEEKIGKFIDYELRDNQTKERFEEIENRYREET